METNIRVSGGIRTRDSPDVAAEWLAFLLRIPEFTDSNLVPEIGSPD
jgi:hypothetical protein